MRERKEIEAEFINPKFDGYSMPQLSALLTLEVVLDIRDQLEEQRRDRIDEKFEKIKHKE
jgi:hypothetical protein